MSQKVYTEEWRPVVGYEGLYEVSNLGRVKSLDRVVDGKGGGKKPIRGGIMNPKSNGIGYLQIRLSKNGKKKGQYIHRLVAEAFIPNTEGLSQVNHKDEDKTNNRVENLEWCSAKYNMNYGSVKQRIGEKHSKPVAQLSLEGKVLKVFSSIYEAERETGVWNSNICKCIKGHLKKSGGYKWRYAD